MINISIDGIGDVLGSNVGILDSLGKNEGDIFLFFSRLRERDRLAIVWAKEKTLIMHTIANLPMTEGRRERNERSEKNCWPTRGQIVSS